MSGYSYCPNCGRHAISRTRGIPTYDRCDMGHQWLVSDAGKGTETMTADKAREIREQALSDQSGAVGEALEVIYQVIAGAARRGEGHVDYSFALKGMSTPQKNAIERKLKSEGFQIELGGQLDGDWHVCW
jgi:hypothetical protein